MKNKMQILFATAILVMIGTLGLDVHVSPIAYAAQFTSPKHASITVRYTTKGKRRLSYGIGTSVQDTFRYVQVQPWTTDATLTADLGSFANPYGQKVYVRFDVEDSDGHEFLIEGNSTTNMRANARIQVTVDVGEKTYTQENLKILVSASGKFYALFIL